MARLALVTRWPSQTLGRSIGTPSKLMKRYDWLWYEKMVGMAKRVSPVRDCLHGNIRIVSELIKNVYLHAHKVLQVL